MLYRIDRQGRSNCPQCRGRVGDVQGEAIRFVRACPNGHLDDVDWPGTVHGGAGGCVGQVFEWVEQTGSDLRSVRIRCTVTSCAAEASLLDIYQRTYACSGYFPEEDGNESCGERASIVLRSATSLRIAEIASSLTIPPRALRIHTLLRQRDIGTGLLLTLSGNLKQDLLAKLRGIVDRFPGRIDPATIAEIERTPDEVVESAIQDLLQNPGTPKTALQVKDEEFDALQDAAERGYPPRPDTGPQFEVDRNDVIRYPHRSGLTLRVTPVKRLRVVLVQRGYRRPVRGPNCRLVERYYVKDGTRWYPGVALHGEGIFIDIPDAERLRTDPAREELWKRRMNGVKGTPDAYLYHPLFIWWHTLAHRLIIGLSLDSGYSSSAIRERIYFRERSGREPAGGILLYTSQHGSDGSLGGLIALAGKTDFPRVMSAAERSLNACSNDPLCSENTGRDNGAACYACLLISETSCELHNTYLDRLLLGRSLAGRIK